MQLRPLRLPPSSLFCLLAALGCAPATGDERPEEALSSADSEIINGALDSAHPAAVAYIKPSGSKCSATIIAVNGDNGYALTAAHCISSSNGEIRQGPNHNTSYIAYPVVEKVVHPGYTTKGPLLDFAVVRFTGTTANPPPVMPPMSPAEDSLAVGQIVTLVGYGQGSSNSRHFINRPIFELSALRLVYDQATGGQCFGDSGGPAVRATGGGDRVAAVASTVTDANPECSGFGTGARVSAVYDTFIMPVINQTAYLPQSCDECFEAVTQLGTCYGAVEDCFNNAGCDAYVDCINGCTTIGCQNQCATNNPSGAALYEQIFTCACDSQCVTECQGDDLCAEPAVSCGLSFSDSDCNGCIKDSCCSESAACAADSGCSPCYPNCPGNGSADALTACLETSCSDTCGFLLPGTGGEGGAGGQPGTGGAGLAGTGTGTDTGTPVSDDANTEEDGGCAMTPAGAASRDGLMLLSLLGLVAATRRRRALS